ncbi:MAG: hypothetical protein B6241_08070 [Spirochaetaceae bacterium 4572_59]|nr:MAG: hypothetical protein B6241_08070 [Spirochaetaceae bacterium 4572_59]
MNIKYYLIAILALAFSSCQPETVDKVETDTLPPPAPLIHPDFSLTFADLEEIIAHQPDKIQEEILAKPEVFLDLIEKLIEIPEDLLVLLNKEIGLGAEDRPTDLVELDEYKHILTLSRRGHHLRKVVMPALLAMNEAAEQEGLYLMISSTYRSYEYQKGLFTRYAETDGVEAAERYSARPGKSQHQLGTAIDFGSIDESFATTAEGIWIKKHAGEFGFSLSYPQGQEEYTGYMWESWHFRYITPLGCEIERKFFGGSQERMLRFLHSNREYLNNHRI